MTAEGSYNNDCTTDNTNQTKKSNTVASESVEVRHQSNCVFHLYVNTLAWDRGA